MNPRRSAPVASAAPATAGTLPARIHRRWPALSAALLLGALVAAPAGAASKLSVGEEAPARSSSAPTNNAQSIYQIVLGEFALARQRPELAAAAYLDLAMRSRDPQVITRAIEVASYAHQYEAALRAAELWVEIEPQSAPARETLVSVLVLLDRVDQAVPYLEELFAEAKGNRADDLLRLNRLFISNTDKHVVQAAVERLTAPYLQLPEAHYARAQAALAAKQPEAALSAIRAARKLRPDWDAALLFEAQMLVRDEQTEAAIQLVDRYLQDNPKQRDVRLYLARMYVGAKHYPEARNELKRLLADSPDDAEVVYPVAILALQQNDLETAEQQLRRLLYLDFNDRSIVHYFLGQIAEERQRHAEAREWYEQVGFGEHYLGARTRLANLLAQDGKLDAARQLLHDTRTYATDEHAQLLLSEAQLLRQAKQYQSAFEVIERALDKMPNQPALLYDGALLAERIKRYEVMESWMRRLIKLQPDNPMALNALGYSFAERNVRLDEALKLVRSALELTPNDAYILDSLGWIYYRQKNYAAALETLERAYKQTADAEIAAHLGEVLWQIGRADDARRTWQEAAQRSPDNEELTAVMKKYLP